MSNELTAISPIDGRYHNRVKELSKYFSEYALIKKRIFVELEYLKELGKGDFLDIHEKFDLKEAQKVKDIEKITNHDVKSVEYYIKEKVPEDVKEYVHFGLTSEDINNLSYSLLINDFINSIYCNKIEQILIKLKVLSVENMSLSMLARTHGQPASPTTLGKELFVFLSRLKNQFEKLKKIKLTAKLNGATGNYNALVLALPNINWVDFSIKFINRLGLEPNLITTQIEPKDTLIELFHNIKRINNILLDLNQDIWLYISLDYFKLKKKDGEVGSSTMPHKVNPIDFENSEGNIKIANSLFNGFESLQISRMQRDLSDSTMLRNIGVAMAHSIIAYDSTFRGLNKLIANKDKLEDDLNNHPQILTEGIQTILRKYNSKKPYEMLKKLSRGKVISLDIIREFVNTLDIDKKDKETILHLNPKDYIGLAKELVK